MNKKSLWITIVACITVAAVSIGATMAWLTDKDDAKNAVSIGNVQIKVIDEGQGPIAPASSANDESGWNDKTPKVQNVGANPCVVRASIVVSPIAGTAKFKDEHSTLLAWGDADGKDFVLIKGFSSDWLDGGDGYYYYNKVLPTSGSDAQTAPVFEAFKLTENYLEIAGENFDFHIYAEAIQAEHVLVDPADLDYTVEYSAVDLKEAFENVQIEEYPYSPSTAP